MALKTYRHIDTNAKITAKCFDPPVEVGGTIEGCRTLSDDGGVYLNWHSEKCYLDAGRENWFGFDSSNDPQVWTHAEFQVYKPSKF